MGFATYGALLQLCV